MRVAPVLIALIAFSTVLFSDCVFASESSEVKPAQNTYVLKDADVQKIFSLGRAAGASYFHLANISDKSKNHSYSELQEEYSQAILNLNLMEVILDDINFSDSEKKALSKKVLNKIRRNFLYSLETKDLNSLLNLKELSSVRDSYLYLYDIAAFEAQKDFTAKGSWLLNLGFYTAFQQESLKTPASSRLLLSGFSRLGESVPFSLSEVMKEVFRDAEALDKAILSPKELMELYYNISEISAYFENYHEKGVSSAKKLLNACGTWRGTLTDPENRNRRIQMRLKEDLSAEISIDGVANSIPISDIRVINDYFSFVFKPFGSEKFSVRFSAKFSDNELYGEVADSFEQRGSWILSKIMD